jgi:hypothetical protein
MSPVFKRIARLLINNGVAADFEPVTNDILRVTYFELEET